MKTCLKLFNGRKVAIEQTTTAILATFEGEEPKRISSQDYMHLVCVGTPCGNIE